MDKQEWTPKLGDEVWEQGYCENHVWLKQAGEVVSVPPTNGHCWPLRSRGGYFNPSCFFPTRDLAKAALIQKLEAALEEAKRL